MTAMPVSSSVPVTETLDAPPPPPGVKSNGLLRRLFRRDGDETIANQAPMSRNITPGGIDSDLSGLGTKPVLAAGENLDKVKFVVPGSVLPTPNSPPPLPPGVMPLPRQYPSLQYATQVPGAMPSSAAGNPEMANPFVPMQNQSAPNWSPSESNAFARPTEDLVPPPQIAEAGRRGMLRRLLHRDANQEPVPTNTAGTGDSALAANGFATSGLNNSMEGLPSSQPRVLPASMTSAQTQSVLDGDCGQSLASLHNSMLPSQREMAADALATTDWRSNPAVVSALLRSAREDPAPTVRSACVRSLVKMNVNSGVAVSTLQALKFDTDMQVRSDANAALAALAASASANQGIQPTSFVGHSPSK